MRPRGRSRPSRKLTVRTTTARSPVARSSSSPARGASPTSPGSLGQPASEAGITVTDPEQTINVDLDVADATLLAVGDEVTVELPDGSTVAGHRGLDRRGEHRRERGDDDPGRGGGRRRDRASRRAARSTSLSRSSPPTTSSPSRSRRCSPSPRAATPWRCVTGRPPASSASSSGTFADGLVEITGDIAEGAEVVVA